MERKQNRLVGSRFGFFVTDESKPIFNQFLEDLIKTKETGTCVITLNKSENQNSHALLTGHITRSGEFCMVAIVDISDFIESEKKNKQLEYLNSLFINRELKMVELKKEINQLLEKAGLEKKY